MNGILKMLGVGVVAISLAGCGASHTPYKDPGINDIYNLLFCDDLSLFQKNFAGEISSPWDVLFSSNPDVEALKNIASSPSLEGRVRMLAYNQLRALNQPVPEKELLGVIIEVGLNEGLDTLAVFSDGGIRYINYTGKTAFVEGGPSAEFEDKAKAVWSASQRIVNAIGPGEEKRLPPPTIGMMRLTFLVSDGLYSGEGELRVMQSEQLAAPLVHSSGELLQLIVDETLK